MTLQRQLAWRAGSAEFFGRVTVFALTAFVGLSLPSALRAQSQGRWLLGTVIAGDGSPVSSARITVTLSPDRHELQTRSDAAGVFRLRLPVTDVDLLLHVTALGFAPYRVRRRFPADSAELGLNVVLQRVTQVLNAVRVEAAPRSPPRSDGSIETETGASQTLVGGVAAGLSPNQQGNVADIAAAVPGVVGMGNGVSTLGVASSQNSTTLNGLAYAGATFPRELRPRTRVTTASYDPARGGYGGLQTALELPPGNEWTFHLAHLTVDAPQFQAQDATSRAFGQSFTRIDAGIGGEGELVPGRFTYNGAVQVTHQTALSPSLLTLSNSNLAFLGVAPDSINRLRSIISSHYPALGLGAGSRSVGQDRILMMGRVDRVAEHRRSEGLLGFVSWSGVASPGGGEISSATHGIASDQLGLGGQFVFSQYFHDASLEQFKASVSANRQRVSALSSFHDGTLWIDCRSVRRRWRGLIPE